MNDLEKDSPTCSKEAFRTILAINAQNELIPHIMDIKTAFLQGEQINREMYIHSPLKGNLRSKKKLSSNERA